MPRVKRGTISIKRRRKVLKAVKGYRFGRSTKERMAREAMLHAGAHAFAHRRKKKGDFRRLWQIRIGAGTRALGMPYNKFIHGLTKANIQIDRKILADLAANEPAIFQKIVEMAR